MKFDKNVVVLNFLNYTFLIEKSLEKSRAFQNVPSRFFQNSPVTSFSTPHKNLQSSIIFHDCQKIKNHFKYLDLNIFVNPVVTFSPSRFRPIRGIFCSDFSDFQHTYYVPKQNH